MNPHITENTLYLKIACLSMSTVGNLLDFPLHSNYVKEQKYKYFFPQEDFVS